MATPSISGLRGPVPSLAPSYLTTLWDPLRIEASSLSEAIFLEAFFNEEKIFTKIKTSELSPAGLFADFYLPPIDIFLM
jgi:hypothetical protein